LIAWYIITILLIAYILFSNKPPDTRSYKASEQYTKSAKQAIKIQEQLFNIQQATIKHKAWLNSIDTDYYWLNKPKPH